MIHRNDLRQRYEDGSWRPERYDTYEWLPPRPKGYNIRDPNDLNGTWYLFDQNHVIRQQGPPGRAAASHYKTFSFYVNNLRIWVYPCNALTFAVGDGLQNPPSVPGETQTDTVSGSENDEDDDDLETAAASFEDWTELAFTSITRDDGGVASFATTRGDSPTLHVQRPNHAWPSEVLPQRYWLDPIQHTDNRIHHGMMAEVPIKIALVAFSVSPSEVHNALVNCFHDTYLSFGQTPGLGWLDKRGLVVRVYCERDADQSLQLFEENGLGLGDYFP